MDSNGIPFISNISDCIDCFFCDRVCSGIQVNFELLSQDLGIKNPKNFSPYIGYYKELHLSYARDLEIQKNSSAGGVVTTLLKYAFENNLIDGAIVVRMSNSNPIRAEGYIATSSEDLHGSSQSKYQPVSLVSLLKDISDFKSIAFVGTGCQVEAVRKFCKINSKVREKIKYTIGLFCAYGNNSLEGTKFLIRKLGFRDLDKVKKISYRNGKYPGNFVVESNKKNKSLSKNEYKWFSLLFTESRCMNCIDYTNELADISVGDSYSLSADNIYGKSIVIVRNQIGIDLLNTSIKNNHICSEPLNISDILKCQIYQFNISKNVIPKRIQKKIKSGKSICPIYVTRSTVNEKLSIKGSLESLFTFFIFYFRKCFILFFRVMPFFFFKLASRISKRD